MGYEKAVLDSRRTGKRRSRSSSIRQSTTFPEVPTYAEKRFLGLDDPFTQYIAGEAETLKITLMFDTYMPPGEKNAEGGEWIGCETPDRKKSQKLMELDPKKKHRRPK